MNKLDGGVLLSRPAWWPGWRLLPPVVVMVCCWLALWTLHTTFTRHWAFQVLFAIAYLAYGWALLIAWRLQDVSARAQTMLVLGVALLLHMLLLPTPYAFSDDVFRYVWDGRVSAAGIDPYRYPPGDPALAFLRDDAIWPYVNAKEQPSPYPPLLETTFALVYRLMPESLLAMKVAMLVLNMGVIAVLLALLRRYGKPPLLALIYAWNPQVVFQVAFSGHNEPLMLFWLLLALWWGKDQRPGGRLLGAWALALATLAKLVPLLVFPFILLRWGWRAALVYGATLGAVYAALLLRGQQVFSGALYEAGTAQFNDGAYYLFYRTFKALGFVEPHDPARLVAAACLGAVMLALLLHRSNDLALPLGVLLAAYVVLTPSVAPWYALWVLPFVALETLPRLVQHAGNPQLRLFGSYWLIFAWSVTLSEVFYFERGIVWIIAHLLVYALPIASVLGAWLYTRRETGGQGR